MSADEDTELRDLVAQTLESKGVLGKIRAQLRASVFLALEEQESKETKAPFVNPTLKKFLNTNEGVLVTGLVREFLEFFELDFSIAVFDPETNFSDKYQGRYNLARELQLSDSENAANKPLLSEVVKLLSSPKTVSAGTKASLTNGEAARETGIPLYRQDGPTSPRNASPSTLSVGKVKDDENLDSESDDNMTGGSKVSKIPQRIKDDKSSKSEHSQVSDISDSFFDKLDSRKDKLSNSDHSKHDRNGSPDLTFGSDVDDNIFGDSPPKSRNVLEKDSRIQNGRTSEIKGTLEQQSGVTKPIGGMSSLTGAPPLPGLGSSGLGSLKGAPPIPGIGMNANKDTTTAKSPNFSDLAHIDNKINKLGFNLGGSETADKSSHSQQYNDDYEDDFQPTSEEEIEEQLSIGSYHSGTSSKLDDLLTSDRTVSQVSVGGLDYVEDVMDF